MKLTPKKGCFAPLLYTVVDFSDEVQLSNFLSSIHSNGLLVVSSLSCILPSPCLSLTKNTVSSAYSTSFPSPSIFLSRSHFPFMPLFINHSLFLFPQLFRIRILMLILLLFTFTIFTIHSKANIIQHKHVLT